MDLDKVKLTTTHNSFKNTGVYTTSIDLPTSVPTSSDTTRSVSITLEENQVFSFAMAKYTDIVKDIGPVYQPCNTFDGKYEFTSPFSGTSSFYLTTLVNGPTVTFTVGIFQTTGSTITVTPQNIPIKYVTYTVDS